MGTGFRDGARVRALVVSAAFAVGLLGSSAVVAQRTESAFTGSTASTATLGAGKVEFERKAQSVPVVLTDLEPGDSGVFCLAVEYVGSAAPVNVRMYTDDASDPDGLGEHVDLDITLINAQGQTPCAEKTGTLVFSGTAETFVTTVVDHASGLGTWRPLNAPQLRTWRFAYTVSATPPQEAAVEFALVWEGRTD